MIEINAGAQTTQGRGDGEKIENIISGRIKDAAIEVKATEINHAIHKSQVLTYLRLTGLRLGLVLNFGQDLLINGLFRVANDL